MIPVLRKSLSQIYATEYFIEEFPSGLGIADLIFTKDLNLRDFVLDDFESMFYLNEHFSSANQKICIDEKIRKHSLNKYKVKLALKFLKRLNLINECEEGKFLIDKAFTPSTSEIYSVEAKLKDWRSGLYQAIRYKVFSHKTFLAIDEAFIHRVDKSAFELNNVGLIVVNSEEAKIILDPYKKLPSNLTAFYCFSERFVSYFKDITLPTPVTKAVRV